MLMHVPGTPGNAPGIRFGALFFACDTGPLVREILLSRIYTRRQNAKLPAPNPLNHGLSVRESFQALLFSEGMLVQKNAGLTMQELKT
ncbi:hypothetical protein [Desulfovirgula thermocuniculi]|uniref:hypothetical protein n=1 Tax=Desulfovirgula thermocuniculi TaxID=348842 RepID=UPI0012ECA17A|nr:hypothetical protein [Desulfovirgula thermocuniculi]